MSQVQSNIRSAIYQIVSAIDPLDFLEREQIDFVKKWILSDKEIFRITKPATPNTHLVSYFAVISPYENKILLVDHKKAKLWLPPGGHVEVDEHPKDTVKREVKEELGIEADFLLEFPLFLTISQASRRSTSSSHTDVSLWYVLNATTNVQFDYDKKEFKQIQWFGIDELPLEKSDPHMNRFIIKLKKNQMLRF